MSPLRRSSALSRHPVAATWVAAFVLVVGLGVYFVFPAFRGCGAFPAPLDDVYIHADFARALAAGHPFEWIAGNGYSSGETAPLYPFLLAPGVLLGLDDERIVAFAFVLAAASLATSAIGLARLFARVGARAYARPAAVATVLAACAVGTVGFTFFSGMEAAAFFAACVLALDAADEARSRPLRRARATFRLGLLGAAMVLLRPEGIVVVFVLALVAARGARSRGALRPFVVAVAPAATATAFVLLLNRLMTGDFASAGARLKLLGSNPFLDDVARAKELFLNLFTFGWKVLGSEIGPFGAGAIAIGAGLGLATRRARDPVLAASVSAIVFALLVSTNGAARYQGLRYYAPAIALVVVGAVVGAVRAARRAPVLACAIPAVLAAGCAPRFVDARDYFRRASENVHGQQVRMGKEIAARLPGSARVLVGDAGAIPFFSRRVAIDALGLGGYLRRPFVRAAVHGEGAILETLERLPRERRPTHLALYPNWFPRTTTLFGREILAVTIDDNVICGGPTKVLYEARWDALGDGDAIDAGFPPIALRGAFDTFDVADVESEALHRAELPTPNGGYPVAEVLRGPGGALRFDGGRIVGEGRVLAFVARGLGARTARVLHVRGDAAGLVVDVAAPGGGCTRVAASPSAGAFTHARCVIALGDGDRVALVPREREARVFHVWIDTP